jgi:DNA-binding NarL/FixJ family response regulator
MPIRILIADDHDIVRLGLRVALREFADLEVVADAPDGEVAISRAIECAPDVVLMDIRMPKMDGIEATMKIKERLKGIRVLILTSNEKQIDLFASLAAGADGYCLKDTPIDELVRAIQTVHSGAAWLDPQIARLVLRSATAALTQSTAPGSVSAESFGLSPREIDILRLLVDGLSNREIADRLSIGPETVKSHMKHIMRKFQVTDRTMAAVKAMREGLV